MYRPQETCREHQLWAFKGFSETPMAIHEIKSYDDQLLIMPTYIRDTTNDVQKMPADLAWWLSYIQAGVK